MDSTATTSLPQTLLDPSVLGKCIDHIVAEVAFRCSTVGLSEVYLLGDGEFPQETALFLLQGLNTRISVPVSYLPFSELDRRVGQEEYRATLQRSFQVDINPNNLRDLAERPPADYLYARFARTRHIRPTS